MVTPSPRYPASFYHLTTHFADVSKSEHGADLFILMAAKSLIV